MWYAEKKLGEVVIGSEVLSPSAPPLAHTANDLQRIFSSCTSSQGDRRIIAFVSIRVRLPGNVDSSKVPIYMAISNTDLHRNICILLNIPCICSDQVVGHKNNQIEIISR